MAKVRVYELAKSLDKESKEIIDLLKKNGVEVKNHMSSVSEEDAKKVSVAFAAKSQDTSNPKTEQTTSRKPVKEIKASVPSNDLKQRPQNDRSENRSQGVHPNRPVRPQEERSNRQQGDRPIHPQGERPMRSQGERQNRPQGDRPNRPQGDRPMRPQGDRREFGNRPQGERGSNPQGDRREFGNRPQGERGFRPQGDRREFGNRPQGERSSRSQGDRREFGNHPQGERGGARTSQNNYNGGRRDGRRDEKVSIPAPMDRASMDRDRLERHKDKRERDKTSQFEDGDTRKKSRKKEDHFTERNNKSNKKPIQKPKPKEPEEPVIRTIELPEVLTVQELADKVKTPVSQLIKKLFLAGEMVTVNTDLDFEKAAEIALEYNCIAEEEVKVDVIEEMLKEEEEDASLLLERPPVVCVMGHVDHGKTSLLDAIRETSVTQGEAGGITQHIGAYTVDVDGQKITFLDTPGHEAFTAMRMRGAQSTDIAILVVAADDGVMPQTVEAINHAKAAGIEIIVAVNKIDKESANIERVKQELVEYELIAEDWGGSTVFCPVSAHTKEGIDNLLEMILLTAEVLELKANPNRKARGIVIEAELDKGRGPVATMLVQKGTLKVGDTIAVGESYGRVRAMIDDKGRKVTEATPSTPVEILGLNGVPAAGEIFVATQNEKEARAMAETYIAYGKEKLIAETKAKMSLDDLFSQIQAGNVKELNLVVKADVQGSVEAVKQSLLKLSNEEVVIKVIHAGVGAINESDVILASASNAIIIGFNVRPDAQAKDVAEREKVDLRLYKVIYNAIEDIESAMKGMLDPIFEEQVTGHLVVRQTFKASGVGTIAGCFVLDGVVKRNSSVRITREEEQIYEGPIASLKRFKDDVKEVKNGFECGIVIENFNDLKEDDQIEVYEMVEVPR